MTDTELVKLAKKHKRFKEAKGEPLTLQEYADLFEGLLNRFLK